MEQLRIGDQLIEFDSSATATGYAALTQGGAEGCGCSFCRNFAAQRDSAYPLEFLSLLEKLGIDFRKEDEIYECGPQDGGRLYGGWFFFGGRLLESGEQDRSINGFRYYFRHANTLPGPDVSFGDAPTAALEFTTVIPWILDEPC